MLAGEQIDPWHGSYHWIYERSLAILNFCLIGTAIYFPSSAVNMALGVALPIHIHTGFGAIITDYLPKRKFPMTYPVMRMLLYAATAGTLYGLYQFNTKDVGISEGMRRLWMAKKEDSQNE